MKLKEELYDKLSADAYKINNHNSRLIEMNKFLSFLTFKTERRYDCLGSCNGWTEHRNDDMQCIISGGIYKGVQYLDRIQFGVKLANVWNNYVNPFYLFDYMTKEGRSFFIDYYKYDIDKIIENQKLKIKVLQENLKDNRFLLSELKSEIGRLKLDV